MRDPGHLSMSVSSVRSVMPSTPRGKSVLGILKVVLLVILSLSFLINILLPVSSTSTSDVVANDAEQVVGTSSYGSPSLSSPGSQNLIEDGFGKFLAVYVDYAGKLSVTYANSNPLSSGAWATSAKSPGTTAYAYPAAVLVNSTLLRIVAENVTGLGLGFPGAIVDVPVSILRGSGNSIADLSFGTQRILDGSHLAQFPSAILAHNGDVLAAWSWFNGSSQVKTLRWNHLTDAWTSFSGSISNADSVIVDNSSLDAIIPIIIERHDNFNVYVFGNYADSGPSNLVFNKANFTGEDWSWGSQSLGFEATVAHALEDAPSVAWDPVKNVVVTSYRVTGEKHYGVFTLNSFENKVHIDTPNFSVSTPNFGSIAVNGTSGDYYLFLTDVNTDGGTGNVKYARSPLGSNNWSSTLTVIDSGLNNRALSLRRVGSDPTMDLLYEDEGTVPSTIRIARVSVGFLTPALVADFSRTPSAPNPGQPVTFTATSSGGVPPYAFVWSFGDGTLGSGPVVTHTYTSTEAYTAQLNVSDSAGSKASRKHGVIASSASFQFAEAGDWDFNSHTSANWQSLSTSGVNFTLAIGDFLYNLPTTQQQQQSWCSNFKGSVPGGNVEILTGNHETFEDNMTSGGGSINKYILYCPFTLGSYVGTYGFQYYFDYPATAPLARFIMVDPGTWLGTTSSSRVSYSAGSPAQQWVGAQIGSARAKGIPWIVVGMHKVCISSGVEGCEAGNNFTNFLMSMGVDLVLQGHDHEYQRSKQLTCSTDEVYISSCVVNDGSTGLYRKGDGTVFLITGTGGGLLDHVNVTDGDYGYFASLNATSYGYAKISVSANSLQGQFVATSGGSFKDNWAISSSNSAPVWLGGGSLKGSNVSGKSLTLSWTPALDVNHVSGYRLYYNGSLSISLPGSVTSYNVTGLTPLAHYMFQIQAGNPAGFWTINGPSTSLLTDLKADVNQDCRIDIIDLVLVSLSFGARTGSPGYKPGADLNGDRAIDILDLVLISSTFGQAC